MFKDLTVFRMAYGMARHAGTRQAAIARNIANADTPGYRAQDVTPWPEMLKQGAGATVQRATREGHLNGQPDPLTPVIHEVSTGYSDPNGNRVSLEQEMLKAVEVKREHDVATAVYRSSLTILRASLGR